MSKTQNENPKSGSEPDIKKESTAEKMKEESTFSSPKGKQGDSVVQEPVTPEFLNKLVNTLANNLNPKGRVFHPWISILLTVLIAAVTSYIAVNQLSTSKEQSQTYKDQIVPGLLSYLLDGRRFANEQLLDGQQFLKDLGLSMSEAGPGQGQFELCSDSIINKISFRSSLWKATPVDAREENIQKFRDLLWSPMRGILFARLMESSISDSCLNRVLPHAQFKWAGFEKVTLEKTRTLNCNLVLDNAYIDNSNWTGLKMPNVKLRNVTIKESNFYDCNLYAADFHEAAISNSAFTKVDIVGVDFTGCHFEGDVYFYDCDTTGAIFMDTTGTAKFKYNQE